MLVGIFVHPEKNQFVGNAQPFSAEEVAALVRQAVTETGAAGAKDMGKVMAWLKTKLAGRADMTSVSGLVKAALGM